MLPSSSPRPSTTRRAPPAPSGIIHTAMSATAPSADGTRRRRSLGRALDMLSGVFKRRDSAATSPVPAAHLHPQPTTFAQRAPQGVASLRSKPSETWVDDFVSGLDDGPSVLAVDESAVDDADHGRLDETPASSQFFGTRNMNVDGGKGKLLFETHDLRYGIGRISSAEPPVKARRVEKPIRMRVHWTCHGCTAMFGSEKTCRSCGHRRCDDCIRSPLPRALRSSASKSPAIEVAQLFQQTAGAATTNETAPSCGAVVVTDKTLSDTNATAGAPAIATAAIAPTGQENVPPVPFAFQYAVRIGRPRAESTLSHRPKAHIPQRICHECETPLAGPSKSDCQACGHRLCGLCPDHADVFEGARSSQSHVLVPLVERVYRKPRQRVRFTCEHCNVEFTDRHCCANCGHERCDRCARDP